MKPYLYTVSLGGVRRGPFSEGCEVAPSQSPANIDMEKWGSVGYIHLSCYPPITVYQRGAIDMWCASLWFSPVPKHMIPIGRTFHTKVLFSNLNFTNTAFEHRYNLLDPSNDSVEACNLSSGEESLWGWGFEGFVPFKISHPHGYQGVYGIFSHKLPHAKRIRNPGGVITRSGVLRPEYKILRPPLRTHIYVHCSFDVEFSVLKFW